YGCIINGELHIAPLLYNRIYNGEKIDQELLFNLEIIDIDELVYIDMLENINIFAGQQVRVYENGFYTGDGTVTRYPFDMKFENAEVMMHCPFKGQLRICSIRSL